MQNIKNIRIDILFLFFIILFMFFDSYPIFPSVYRPLSLYFVLPIGLFFIANFFLKRNNSILKVEIWLLVYFIYGFLISANFSLLKYRNISGLLDYTITVLLAIISYIAFKRLLFYYDDKIIFKTIKLVSYFYLIVGIIEVLAIFGFIPYFFKNVMNFMFSLKNSSRILLSNSEPSWATMTLLFVINYFISFDKKVEAFIISILILLSFSLQGILELFIFIILINMDSFNLKAIIKFVTIILIIIMFFISVLPNLIIMFNMDDSYFGKRILGLNLNDNFQELLMLGGGSTFIRIMYPYMGFEMSLKNPIGYGGGNYRYEFNDVITDYDYALNVFEIRSNIKKINATPKNLLARAISENGWFGFLILLSVFIYLYLYLLVNSYHIFYRNSLLLIFVYYLQFDSYIYLPAIFLLALILIKISKGKNNWREAL